MVPTSRSAWAVSNQLTVALANCTHPTPFCQGQESKGSFPPRVTVSDEMQAPGQLRICPGATGLGEET